MSARFCPSCGTAVSASDAFCGGCGKPLATAPPPQWSPPPVARIEQKKRISPWVWVGAVVAALVLLRLAMYAARPQAPIRQDTGWNQKDADFFRSDPKELERQKQSAKPWDGKGVDPNFPIP